MVLKVKKWGNWIEFNNIIDNFLGDHVEWDPKYSGGASGLTHSHLPFPLWSSVLKDPVVKLTHVSPSLVGPRRCPTYGESNTWKLLETGPHFICMILFDVRWTRPSQSVVAGGATCRDPGGWGRGTVWDSAREGTNSHRPIARQYVNVPFYCICISFFFHFR